VVEPYELGGELFRCNNRVPCPTQKMISTLALMLLAFSEGLSAMSIAELGRSSVFSAVEVVLTRDGEPVVGAEVTRVSEWQKQQTEKAVTDSEGKFSFPALFENSLAGILPFTEFIASQQIVVQIGVESFEIWANGKRSPKNNSELGGVPIKLSCELNEDVRLVEGFGSLLVTNCRW